MSDEDKSRAARRSRAKLHAEIENLSIMGNTWHAMPLGFLHYAESFLGAARLAPPAPNPRDFSPVWSYLPCHAIELALKAFLSLRGATAVELAKSTNGHNLDVLLERCEAEGLSAFVKLTEGEREAIHLAADYYAEKVFEYPALFESMQAYPRRSPIDKLIAIATRLIEALRKPCLDHN